MHHFLCSKQCIGIPPLQGGTYLLCAANSLERLRADQKAKDFRKQTLTGTKSYWELECASAADIVPPLTAVYPASLSHGCSSSL